MNRIVAAEALAGHRLRLRFADGVAGTVDLSDLAGRGVFARWLDPEFFARVSVGSGGELVWDDQVDLCPDALYLRLTGKAPADILPGLAADVACA